MKKYDCINFRNRRKDILSLDESGYLSKTNVYLSRRLKLWSNVFFFLFEFANKNTTKDASRSVIFAERLTTAITEVSPAIVSQDIPWNAKIREPSIRCASQSSSRSARKKKISGNLREKKSIAKSGTRQSWSFMSACYTTDNFFSGIKSLSSPSRSSEKGTALERRKTRYEVSESFMLPDTFAVAASFPWAFAERKDTTLTIWTKQVALSLSFPLFPTFMKCVGKKIWQMIIETFIFVNHGYLWILTWKGDIFFFYF